MQKSNKLFFSVLLVITLIFSVPVSAIAQSATLNNEVADSYKVSAANCGFSLSNMKQTSVNDTKADFLLRDGYIAGMNGTLIASINISNIDANSLAKALDQSNLKDKELIDTSKAYVIVNARYLGILSVVSMDCVSNNYSFNISSMSLVELEKEATKAIVQGAAKEYDPGNANNSGDGMDSFDLGGMDTIVTGGMDSFDLGGMDTIDTGGMDSIGSGGMDTFDLEEMDYLDTESFTELKTVTNENKLIKLKVNPKLYSNGETLISLEEAAKQTGLSVTYSEDKLTATITGLGNKSVLTAYSDTAIVNGNTIKLNKSPKMDKCGITVPVSFLAKYYGEHFAVNKDKASITISKKPIVEWRYGGYKTTAPYKEYNVKYVDGVKTTVTQLTGKNHIFKDVTLYNKNTGKKVTVKENKVASYGKDWAATPPSKSSGNSSTADGLNQFYNRMNLQRYFNSSSFNTYGGGVIRRLLPF